MNGPVLGMYSMKTIFPVDSKFFSNSSMYHMKPMLDSTSSINITDDQFKSVSEKQNLILARIGEIKECLIILRTMLDERQSVTVPEQKSVIQSSTNCNNPIFDVTKWGTREIVVNASIEKPPFSLVLLNLLGDLPVNIESHIHSSLKNIPHWIEEFSTLFKRHYHNDTSALKIRVIWKKGPKNTEVVLGRTPMEGETSVLRFVHGMLGCVDGEKEAKLQEHLDTLHLEGPAALSDLPSASDSIYLLGQLSVLDLAAWSAIKNLPNTYSLPPNLLIWFSKFDALVKPLTVP